MIDAASLLCSQEQKCVGYLYAKSSSYIAHNCEIWNSFCATRDQGVATEQLFRGMPKGRVPSTTLQTASLCAWGSVYSTYSNKMQAN